jgi:hypothetical protein
MGKVNSFETGAEEALPEAVDLSLPPPAQRAAQDTRIKTERATFLAIFHPPKIVI